MAGAWRSAVAIARPGNLAITDYNVTRVPELKGASALLSVGDWELGNSELISAMSGFPPLHNRSVTDSAVTPAAASQPALNSIGY